MRAFAVCSYTQVGIEVTRQICGHLVPSSFDRARAVLDNAYQVGCSPCAVASGWSGPSAVADCAEDLRASPVPVVVCPSGATGSYP